MSRRLRYALFGLVCAAQIAVPASMVVQHERTRSSGSLWRFQTAPVDPNDPFRGRYVRLNFAASRAQLPVTAGEGSYPSYGERLYAELGRDDKGFAVLHRLHATRPTGIEYLDVFVADTDFDDKLKQVLVRVRLPFDRFYLQEAKASEVERTYAEVSRRAQDNTYAEVRVLGGHAALVSLVLDGQPVSR